jgi:hypothetical protein
MTRYVLAIAALAALAGCTPTPPAVAAPRSGTTVAASQSKTWDAVIDVFADRSIPIKNMERASGFIATDPLGTRTVDLAMVDCGKDGLKQPRFPTLASYNVLVRGDSTSSNVKATVRWTSRSGSGKDEILIECTTKGVWESQFERDVKLRAEGK